MLGGQPLDPKPSTTLADATGDLEHRHAFARISPSVMTPCAIGLPTAHPAGPLAAAAGDGRGPGRGPSRIVGSNHGLPQMRADASRAVLGTLSSAVSIDRAVCQLAVERHEAATALGALRRFGSLGTTMAATGHPYPYYRERPQRGSAPAIRAARCSRRGTADRQRPADLCQK
jgi:hypothetical protein